MNGPTESDVYVCDTALKGHRDLNALVARLAADKHRSFRDALPALVEFSRSAFLKDALISLVRRVHIDESFQLSRFTQEGQLSGFVLASGAKLSINLGLLGPSAPIRDGQPASRELTLSPFPADCYTFAVAADGVEQVRYRLADEQDPILVRISAGTVRAGDHWLQEAKRDLATHIVRGHFVYLEISTSVSAPILPVFDATSLQRVGWRSADSISSRIELLTRTLAEFGYRRAVPQLLNLAHHRDHHVRWGTIRHLLRIDPIAGRASVAAATNDEHPDVRGAARRTLEVLEQAASG